MLPRYTIQSWKQPKPGFGWVRCSENAKGARFFVFSRQKSVRDDRLHGRDFATRKAARAAIAQQGGQA